MSDSNKNEREYDPRSFDYMMEKDETAPTKPKFDSANDAPLTRGEKALKALGCSCLVILALFFALGLFIKFELHSAGFPGW